MTLLYRVSDTRSVRFGVSPGGGATSPVANTGGSWCMCVSGQEPKCGPEAYMQKDCRSYGNIGEQSVHVSCHENETWPLA